MNRTDWRAFIRREIVLFIQYAVIASLAAWTAHDTLWLSDYREMNPNPVPSKVVGEDVCSHGMLRVLVRVFWTPWLQAFLPLALARATFFSLAFWYRGRIARRIGEPVHVSAEFCFRREIRSFVSYGLVSFAALTSFLVFYIGDSLRKSLIWSDRVPRWLGCEADIFEVVKSLGERFYGPGLATFIFLASARLLAVFVVRKGFPRRDRA